MKVINQYIVFTKPGKGYSILFECENNIWFTTTEGTFMHQDRHIKHLPETEAKKLIERSK